MLSTPWLAANDPLLWLFKLSSPWQTLAKNLSVTKSNAENTQTNHLYQSLITVFTY
ncbi:hypothetical protein [Piscirickettsia salmonis]|uniref:hypothetical protein n=1 Tax=Piscirickettsia salmonis TaxID=1238 RepID=UPI001E522856|nr:hypothetical protein [Piscirickettsia salmonis]